MNIGDWLSGLFGGKYSLVYTALSDEECMRIIGKLRDSGVKYKTKIRGIYATSTRGFGWGRKQSQYDIYVKKEDACNANQAIRT